jgi:hypothetical protein
MIPTGSFINHLKKLAINILITETFSYMDAQLDEQFRALAKENQALTGIPDDRYLYDCMLFPIDSRDGVISNIPSTALHYSLYEKHKALYRELESVSRIHICNYFTAVVNASYNNLVLHQLLPSILISTLQQKLTTEDYDSINRGSIFNHQQLAISVGTTEAAIQDIKNNYKTAIGILKKVLMDKFLLQGS